MEAKNIFKNFLAIFAILITVLAGVSYFVPGVKAFSFSIPGLPGVPGLPSAPSKPEPPSAPSGPSSYPMPTSPFGPTCTPTPKPGGVTPQPGVTQASSATSQGGVGGTGGNGGGGSDYHCGAATPPAPYLRMVKSLGFGKVELSWDPVSPATHYSISYGPSSENYIYGVSDTGNTTSFEIGELGKGSYCFAVRAVNDCVPSELSNERCTGGIGGVQILGASTLGATGESQEEIFQILFIIGSVCVSLGLKTLLTAGKKA